MVYSLGSRSGVDVVFIVGRVKPLGRGRARIVKNELGVSNTVGTKKLGGWGGVTME